MAKFVTNAAMWSLNLVQVTESISGSVVPLAMFYSCIHAANSYSGPGNRKRSAITSTSEAATSTVVSPEADLG